MECLQLPGPNRLSTLTTADVCLAQKMPKILDKMCLPNLKRDQFVYRHAALSQVDATFVTEILIRTAIQEC